MEHQYVKTDIDGYLKDPKTNVIVATNFEKFRSMKAEQQKLKELDRIRSDVDSLRDDLNALFNHLGFTR